MNADISPPPSFNRWARGSKAVAFTEFTHSGDFTEILGGRFGWGISSKKLDAPYASGKSKSCKVKNPKAPAMRIMEGTFRFLNCALRQND